MTTDWKPGDAPGEDGLEGHADLPVQLPGEAFGPPTLDEVTELRRFRMALPMGSKGERCGEHGDGVRVAAADGRIPCGPHPFRPRT